MCVCSKTAETCERANLHLNFYLDVIQYHHLSFSLLLRTTTEDFLLQLHSSQKARQIVFFFNYYFPKMNLWCSCSEQCFLGESLKMNLLKNCFCTLFQIQLESVLCQTDSTDSTGEHVVSGFAQLSHCTSPLHPWRKVTQCLLWTPPFKHHHEHHSSSISHSSFPTSSTPFCNTAPIYPSSPPTHI